MSNKIENARSEYIKNAKCGDKPMQMLEVGIVNISGKEISAYGGSICEGEFVKGYIHLKDGLKHNWNNRSKSFNGILKTWDGKQVISEECHQLLEFYHEYRDLSLWAVKYNGKWYVGGKDEQLFSGNYVQTTSFEEWLEKEEQFEKYDKKKWDSKEDYESEKEDWLAQKEEEFEEFEFEEAIENIDESCESGDYFDFEDEEESDEEEDGEDSESDDDEEE